MTATLAYNPDQERDDKGQWAPTGEKAADQLDGWGDIGVQARAAAAAVRVGDNETRTPISTDAELGDPRFADLPLEQLQDNYARSPANTGDPALNRIWEARGFDGKPTVVSHDEFERLAKEGAGTVLYRGITADTSEQAEQWAEDYRTGDKPYAGFGAGGNGTYWATESSLADRYAAADSGNGAVLRAIVPSDIKSVTLDGIVEEQMAWGERWEQRIKAADPSQQPAMRERRAIESKALQNPGRFASAVGFQAVREPDDTGGRGDVYNILDRSALIVEEATQ